MTSREHAIVLGASMSGLMAARVLCDHFGRVTVLDRDQLPSVGRDRKGVPQGAHAHGLLSSGRNALERLFPGIVDELVARGAIDCEISQDLRFFSAGKPLALTHSELRSVLLTRALLEGHVRERVQRASNVHIQQGCEALELLAHDGVVRGVEVEARAANHQRRALLGELIVDATGRGSRMGRWLQGLGYSAPEEERVGIDLRYVSCFYKRRPEQLEGFKGLLMAADPPNRRTGVVLAQEHDRWIVTLIGYLGEAAEPTHAGMRAFARGLPNTMIYELLNDVEPLTEPSTFRFLRSQRRHFERLKAFPKGLLAIGDTLCSFNPSFGQGMSVAALEALVLADCLQHANGQLWKRMFARSAKLIDTPWTIAVGADLAFPEVSGKRSVVGGVLGRYVDALLHGAVHDHELAAAFLRVAHLIDPPAALLAPTRVLRTLRTQLSA